MEIIGYIVVYFNVFVFFDVGGLMLLDIDLFLMFCYIGKDGKEIFYMGMVGDFVFLIKGWFRVLLRKVNEKYLKY